jgi:hypothetical protein
VCHCLRGDRVDVSPFRGCPGGCDPALGVNRWVCPSFGGVRAGVSLCWGWPGGCVTVLGVGPGGRVDVSLFSGCPGGFVHRFPGGRVGVSLFWGWVYPVLGVVLWVCPVLGVSGWVCPCFGGGRVDVSLSSGWPGGYVTVLGVAVWSLFLVYF